MTIQTEEQVQAEAADLARAKSALLTDWLIAVRDAAATKPIVAKEMELRLRIMKAFFPKPEEGSNTCELGSGYSLKATYKLDRKVDEAAMPAVFEQLRDMGINPDTLINRKPTLDTTAYKSLVIIDKTAAKVFEQALIIKPAAPSIELKMPKVLDTATDGT